jgi:hypothetical protein
MQFEVSKHESMELDNSKEGLKNQEQLCYY